MENRWDAVAISRIVDPSFCISSLGLGRYFAE